MYHSQDINLRKKKKDTKWYRFKSRVSDKFYEKRDGIRAFFIEDDEKKDYDPGDLATHNYKMDFDTSYRRSYFFKCIKHRFYYNLRMFIADTLLTFLILFMMLGLMLVIGIIAFIAMMILVF